MNNYFDEKRLKKSGERIKTETKKHGMNQTELANFLGYENRRRISECWNGKAALFPEQYKKLSEEWNLRLSYLMGFDDYRTEEEYEDYLLNTNYYTSALRPLLQLFGYDISLDYTGLEIYMNAVNNNDNTTKNNSQYYLPDSVYKIITPHNDIVYIKGSSLEAAIEIMIQSIEVFYKGENEDIRNCIESYKPNSSEEDITDFMNCLDIADRHSLDS